MMWTRYLLLFMLALAGTACNLGSLFDRPAPREFYLTQILEASADNPHAGFLRAKGFLEQGKWDRAEADLKRALRSEPDRAEFYIGLGVAYEGRNRYGAARRAYLSALEQHSHSAQAMIRLGRLAWRRGRLEEAADWARQASEISDSADLWRLKGEISYIRLDYSEALRAWEESLRRSANQPVIQEIVRDLRGYLSENSW